MIDPDRAISIAMNSQALPGYTMFFSAVTMLGSAALWLAVLALGLFSRRWRGVSALLIVVIAFSTVINEDVKEIVGRSRPGDIAVPGYFVLHSHSFPSGHTQVAFAIATVVSALASRRYGLIAFLLAIAVGMSRMYLGYHYFTDVLGGALIGAGAGGLAIFAAHRLGLLDRAGTFRFAFRSSYDRPDGQRPGAENIKLAAAALAAGFSIALAAFFLSWYWPSLLAIAITYIAMLWIAARHSSESPTTYGI